MAQAGFDLSQIDSTTWKKGLKQFNLDKVELTEKGWVWSNSKNDDFVVTGNNPITGEYWHSLLPREKEIGYVSYVGIEGQINFVDEFFHWFKDNAEYIKDEVWGKRNFI